MTATILRFPPRPPSERLRSLLAEAFEGKRPRPGIFTVALVDLADGSRELRFRRPGVQP